MSTTSENSRSIEVLEAICARHGLDPNRIRLNNNLPVELKKFIVAQFAVAVFSVARRLPPKGFKEFISMFRDTLLVLVGQDFLESDDFMSFHDIVLMDTFPEIDPRMLKAMTDLIRAARDARE